MDLLGLMEALALQAKFESVFYNFIINLLLSFELFLNLDIIFPSISNPFNLYVLWKLINMTICLNDKSYLHLTEDIGIPQHTHLPTAVCKHQGLSGSSPLDGGVHLDSCTSQPCILRTASSFRPHPSFLCTWYNGSLKPVNWTSARKMSPGKHEEFTQRILLTVVCWENDRMPCRKCDWRRLSIQCSSSSDPPMPGTGQVFAMSMESSHTLGTRWERTLAMK